MHQNVGNIERWASLVTGGIFAAGAAMSKSTGCQIVCGTLGAGLLWRGLSGNCALYSALGVDTAHERGEATAIPAGHGYRVEESIEIDRPASELYSFWRNLEQLPRFMNHLKKVTPAEGGRTHWVAEGPMGLTAEWDAEIHNERDGEMIAWRSVEGSRVDTAGSVHFEKMGNNRTRVRVNLKFDPPMGQTGAALAWLSGASPQKMVREDLERFKQLMETSASAPSSSKGGRKPAMAGR
ncbi:MAG: DUF2892 domain-containing protein [Gemmataceae bacterium]|nr:DUF2892 domain-containing protein [Gemmataceae bacterium]